MDVLSPTSAAQRNAPLYRLARCLAQANAVASADLGTRPTWIDLARTLLALGVIPPTADRIDEGVPECVSCGVDDPKRQCALERSRRKDHP